MRSLYFGEKELKLFFYILFYELTTLLVYMMMTNKLTEQIIFFFNDPILTVFQYVPRLIFASDLNIFPITLRRNINYN